MDAETTRSLTTLAAVVLGFLLGQFAELRRSKKQERKIKASTRALVELEITRNRSLLTTYWSGVITSSENWYGEDGTVNYIKLGRAIIKFPFPPTGNRVWIASFNNLSAAYSPQELVTLWETHEALDQLRLVYEKIALLERDSEDKGRYSESRTDLPSGFISTLVGASLFSNNVKQLAVEFENHMRKALSNAYAELPQNKV